MDFEYDPSKSELNLKKHGMSLEDAKLLWDVPGIEIKARAEDDEPRFMMIARLNGKFYSCVYTIRQNAIRLISMRRSREAEEKIYEARMNNEKET